MAAKKRQPPAVSKKTRPKVRPKKGRKSAAFKKRSEAAKRGWVTRRGLVDRFTRKEVVTEALADAYAALARAKREVEALRAGKAEVEAELAKIVRLDNLPARFVWETQTQHASRVVAILRKQGVYGREEAYQAVAAHTGLNPREVYTLFVYVGVGEFVA